MTLQELITASRVNGWNVVDEILYQTYLDTLAGSGGVSEQILDAIRAFDLLYEKYLNFRSALLGSVGFESIQLIAEEGKIFSLSNATIYNPNAYPVFLKLYETDGVVIGTSPVVYTIMIPALGQIVLDSGCFYANLVEFFTIAVTKLYSDSDTTPIDLPLITQIKIAIN